MPYRAELKRPDLKGQFPCSVCGKIFCHSSSLSRHRMQAHFKSYTCTQCNQEISSNETLRSHMFRMHSISRMFMCRCCNWAFPDKTSLHIHMQSMLRNGTPGDVAVLARSSTEGDGPADLSIEPASINAENLHQKLISSNNNTSSVNNNIGSIFPAALKQENLLQQYIQKDSLGGIDVTNLSSNQWLSAWLANNPFVSNLGLGMSTQNANSSSDGAHTDEDMKDGSDIGDVLEIETTEEDLKYEDMQSHSPTSATVKSENGDEDKCQEHTKGSQKRKATRPVQVPKADSTENASGSLNVSFEDKESCHAEQLSPTVSDSHTSGTISHHGDSPRKCFDCQEAKHRLTISEAKVREYESKIIQLESKIQELQREKPKEKHEFNLPTAAAPPMPFFPVPGQMPFMQNPAMKLLFHNFMQATINRQLC